MSNIVYFDCLCKCIKKEVLIDRCTPYKLTQLIIKNEMLKNEKTKTWKNYSYWL